MRTILLLFYGTIPTSPLVGNNSTRPCCNRSNRILSDQFVYFSILHKSFLRVDLVKLQAILVQQAKWKHIHELMVIFLIVPHHLIVMVSLAVKVFATLQVSLEVHWAN